jgi:hypothetical protein
LCSEAEHFAGELDIRHLLGELREYDTGLWPLWVPFVGSFFAKTTFAKKPRWTRSMLRGRPFHTPPPGARSLRWQLFPETQRRSLGIIADVLINAFYVQQAEFDLVRVRVWGSSDNFAMIAQAAYDHAVARLITAMSLLKDRFWNHERGTHAKPTSDWGHSR